MTRKCGDEGRERERERERERGRERKDLIAAEKCSWRCFLHWPNCGDKQTNKGENKGLNEEERKEKKPKRATRVSQGKFVPQSCQSPT